MGIEEFLTIPEVARILGISRIAIYKRVKKGNIKSIRVGRTFAIARKSIAKIAPGRYRKKLRLSDN